MILAGDIGGTKTALGLFDVSGADLRLVRETTFPSREHASLRTLVETFLAAGPPIRIDGACFGIAGPVEDGQVVTTNLPWVVERSRLVEALGVAVVLLNDLVAAAYGMLFLPEEAFAVLQAGHGGTRGNVAVIAPGTGLGEALLYFDGACYHPVASEGGHADFAARSDVEIDLLRHLRERFDHVSYERVLSGDGISNLYAFLRDSGRAAAPEWLERELESGDPNARITQLGLAGEVEICAEALDLFVSILGAEAGNLALRCAATGGVIVGGGIGPKILPAMKQPGFAAAFADKGRLSGWLRQRRVCAALEPRASLLGAAHFLHDRMERAEER